MDNGRLAYFREGKKYEGGFFGGDIEEAVEGNRQAEEYASEYKTGMVAGFALLMGGAVGLVGGAALGATELSPNGQSNAVPGLLVLAGGLVAYVAGLAVMLNAQPHLFDAINAYNDGVSTREAAPAPSQSTPAPVPAPAR